MKKLYTNYSDIWKTKNTSGDTIAIECIVKKRLYILGMDYTQDSAGNIFAGDFTKQRPCLVSHLDSVHSEKPKRVKLKNGKLTSSSGIGADDKAGIVAILEILKSCNNVNAIFTTDEEIGGIGAKNVGIDTLKNTEYFIQIDRRGNSDLITNIGSKITSDEFLKKISKYTKKYGFKETSGMFTDIDVFTELIPISAINISSGYYNPHSKDEYVNLYELGNTINYVKDIISNVNGTMFDIPKREVYSYDYLDYYNYNNDVEIEMLKRKYANNFEVLEAIDTAYDLGYNQGYELSQYDYCYNSYQ